MSHKEIDGRPYHLWNPYTDLEYFLSFLGLGTSYITGGEGAFIFNPRGDRFLNVNSAVWNVGLGLDAIMRAKLAR